MVIKSKFNQLSGNNTENKPKPIVHNIGINTDITLVSKLHSNIIPRPNQKQKTTTTSISIKP